MENEMKYCLDEAMCIQKKLLCAFNCALDKGIEQMNTQEAGEIADMIKDFAEAEEKCYKACYYKSIVMAMDEHKEKYGWYPYDPREPDGEIYGWYPPQPMYEMYGYNNGPTKGGTPRPMRGGGSYGYRPGQPRDSQGRFVSDGGGRMGFHEGMAEYRMPIHGPESEYGRAYDMYKESRRHFTETGSTTDREEMNQHAKEHLDATIATMGEIYKSSDPELKRQIKMNLNSLVGTMT